MQSKVEIYKGTLDDQTNERKALLLEKDKLFQEHV
jgi:hypothetical protein